MNNWSIVLPIYHLPDGGTELEEMGIGVPLGQCDIFDVVFFRIDAIGPTSHEPNGKKGVNSVIYSSGVTFVSPLNAKEIERRMSKVRDGVIV